MSHKPILQEKVYLQGDQNVEVDPRVVRWIDRCDGDREEALRACRWNNLTALMYGVCTIGVAFQISYIIATQLTSGTVDTVMTVSTVLLGVANLLFWMSQRQKLVANPGKKFNSPTVIELCNKSYVASYILDDVSICFTRRSRVERGCKLLIFDTPQAAESTFDNMQSEGEAKDLVDSFLASDGYVGKVSLN